jgi:CHAD domain-containing protein
VPLELLHRLRIAFKGLRYTLEFFREVLGRDAGKLIEEIKTLQDHLGDLQDAVVTCGIVQEFLSRGTWGHGGAAKRANEYQPVIAPGVVSYLAARQTELQLLLELFPGVWAKASNQKFVKLVATLVAPL